STGSGGAAASAFAGGSCLLQEVGLVLQPGRSDTKVVMATQLRILLDELRGQSAGQPDRVEVVEHRQQLERRAPPGLLGAEHVTLSALAKVDLGEREPV